MRAECINENTGEYIIWCPGCKEYHSLTTLSKNEKGAQQSFNGNLELPTFTPSLNKDKDFTETHCHSVITEGKIQFLDDCFHDLKG